MLRKLCKNKGLNDVIKLFLIFLDYIIKYNLKLKDFAMYKTILCTSASLLFLSIANAGCPTLNLETLPKAVCGNNSALFKTGPLSKMSYVSESPCPSGIALRKKLQQFVKGKKDYPGSVISTKAGEISCTYQLDDAWQKVLTTTSPEIILKAPITTPEQVNYLTSQACPRLTAKDFDTIKGGKQYPMESTRKDGVTYAFKVIPLQKASASARLKEFFNTDDVRLVNLQGVMKIETSFEQRCEYSHSTGGSPVKSVLRGVQDKSVASAVR